MKEDDGSSDAIVCSRCRREEEQSVATGGQIQTRQGKRLAHSRSLRFEVMVLLAVSGRLCPGVAAFSPVIPFQLSVDRLATAHQPVSVLKEPTIEVDNMVTSKKKEQFGNFSDHALDGILSGPQPTRYRAITLSSLDELAEKHPELKPHLYDIHLSGLVFPFKASPHFVDEMIDWKAENIKEDPFYRLVFPTLDMLIPKHRDRLEKAHQEGNPSKLTNVVREIRTELNPQPDGQITYNRPKEEELSGLQHKYHETVLVFPAAAQTCHAYCTYCFRWAQFIGVDELRFSQKEAQALFAYLAQHQEVSDILITGGDPMTMKTLALAQYLEPLTNPDFLPHIKNVRIGTRALTYWPQRFTTDEDANALIDLLRRVREHGGRHVAIMAHIGHPRELENAKFKEAVNRIQKESFATIRSQCPVMRGINDRAELLADKWRKEVQMGIVPYYMFVARDTGAQQFFDVPLAETQRIYSDAIRNCSGLIRTVRGPSMSCTPGKVEVTGIEEIFGQKVFVLRFLQCRDEAWIGRSFFAKYDPKAVWFDDLESLEGTELPWDENGLPKPVPSAVA